MLRCFFIACDNSDCRQHSHLWFHGYTATLAERGLLLQIRITTVVKLVLFCQLGWRDQRVAQKKHRRPAKEGERSAGTAY